jgi:hypothetical protein
MTQPPEGPSVTLEQTIADLRHELAECRAERDDALARETATAEVLGVINSSPGELAPVFEAMLERATRLCEATYGHLFTYDGELLRPVAVHGESGFADWLRQQGPVTLTGGPITRALRGEWVVSIADTEAEEAYRSVPRLRELIQRGSIRSVLIVALRKDDKPRGAFVLYRQELRSFSDKQIALLQNFAAQAVIAIENARLINETREALEQQTATAEVLGLINASPGNLTPVFEAMIERATRLCEADLGTLWTFDGDRFHPAVGRGYGDLGPGRVSGSTPWRGATRPTQRFRWGGSWLGKKSCTSSMLPPIRGSRRMTLRAHALQLQARGAAS